MSEPDRTVSNVDRPVRQTFHHDGIVAGQNFDPEPAVQGGRWQLRRWPSADRRRRKALEVRSVSSPASSSWVAPDHGREAMAMARSPSSASARTRRSPARFALAHRHVPAAVRFAVQSGSTASGAPLTTSKGPSGPTASTEPSRRLKSKACRPAWSSRAPRRLSLDQGRIERTAIAAQFCRDGAELGGAVIFSASGVEASGKRDSAEVSVPVLSVHSTVMAPRSWIEASRFTMTLRRAIRIAPRDSVTVVIIGRSSGVRPTPAPRRTAANSSTERPEEPGWRERQPPARG